MGQLCKSATGLVGFSSKCTGHQSLGSQRNLYAQGPRDPSGRPHPTTQPKQPEHAAAQPQQPPQREHVRQRHPQQLQQHSDTLHHGTADPSKLNRGSTMLPSPKSHANKQADPQAAQALPSLKGSPASTALALSRTKPAQAPQPQGSSSDRTIDLTHSGAAHEVSAAPSRPVQGRAPFPDCDAPSSGTQQQQQQQLSKPHTPDQRQASASDAGQQDIRLLLRCVHALLWARKYALAAASCTNSTPCTVDGARGEVVTHSTQICKPKRSRKAWHALQQYAGLPANANLLHAARHSCQSTPIQRSSASRTMTESGPWSQIPEFAVQAGLQAQGRGGSTGSPTRQACAHGESLPSGPCGPQQPASAGPQAHLRGACQRCAADLG